MAYAGNTPVSGFRSIATKDTFSGDGSTTAFTLSLSTRTNDVEVFVENVQQEPTTAYSISGNTLTFTSAPVSGTDNIYVVYRGEAVANGVHTPTYPVEAEGATINGAITATNATFSTVTASGTEGTPVDIYRNSTSPVYIKMRNDDGSTFIGAEDYLSFWSGGAADGTGATEAMRIDSGGDVGIGTVAPAARLHVANDQGGGTGRVLIDANVSSGYDTKITATDIGLEFTAQSNSRGFVFNSGSTPTERMRIDSSGQVLVGTTALPVMGSSTNQGCSIRDGEIRIVREDISPNLYMKHQIASGTGSYVYFYRNTSIVGSITSNGSSTAYNTTSDYRLKENVVDMTGAIDRVKSLKPSQFNFITDPDKTVDGFLAHEVQAIVPEAVTGEKDAVDADGNPVYQGIDQSKLVPLLTGALQEAIARIETLEAEVATLKGASA